KKGIVREQIGCQPFLYVLVLGKRTAATMEEKKRIGRPPNTGDKKTRTVQFRCREHVYQRLVEAAQSNNRTMSQEIAARLTESFLRPSNFTETAMTLMTEAASKLEAPGDEQLYMALEDTNRQINLLQERVRSIIEHRLNSAPKPRPYPPPQSDQK